MQGAHTAFGKHPIAHDSLPQPRLHGQQGHCRQRWRLAGRGLWGCAAAGWGQLPVAFHVSKDVSNTFFWRKEERFGPGLCSVQGSPETGCFAHPLCARGTAGGVEVHLMPAAPGPRLLPHLFPH